MIYNSLQGIFTTMYMIGFVTWRTFLCYHLLYRWQPIIVVKMPCKLLYVIQVKGFLIKGFNFLISKFLVVYNIAASECPRTFNFYSQAVFV